MTATGTTRPHGTIGRYSFGDSGRDTKHGCRCQPCRNAARRSDLRRQLHGPAYVDGTRVAAHMRDCLAAGMTNHQIALLAGLGEGGRTIIRHLLAKDGRKLRPATARALLAVPVDPCAAIEGASCDATGSRRRLQALVAIGYTERHLAQLLGSADTSPLQVCKRSRCDGATALKISALYRQLANHPGPSDAARARARLLGWLTPWWWDDDTIDDPLTEPEGLREYKQVRHSRGVREVLEIDVTAPRPDQVARLTELGYDNAAIAERLQISRKQVRRDQRRVLEDVVA